MRGINIRRKVSSFFRPPTTPLEDGLPWLVYEAIDWLKTYLNSNMHVFEWGAGGSTIFFSNYSKSVTSVEHDLNWYKSTSDAIAERSIKNVQLMLCKPTKSTDMDNLYGSSFEQYREMSFYKYVRAIEIFLDNSFDLVAVDGRARVACMEYAKRKIKPGGYLLLDDSERSAYKSGRNKYEDWIKMEFYGDNPYFPVKKVTSLWQKPIGNNRSP